MLWSKQWAILVAMLALAFAAATGARTPSGGEIREHEAAGGFPYVTGGVGEAEQAILESRYDDYSFKLVNVRSGPDAAYVAQVEVTITNSSGEQVLSTTLQGPWLMADLPAGQYEVRATFEGATQELSVRVPESSSQQRVLDWHTRE